VRKADALLATVFFIAACADPRPLRIAVVGSNGAPLGAVLAVEDINAAGGIGGRLLEVGIVTEPSLVTARQAIATADSLARDPQIVAVVGHGGSGTSLAASQVYNTRHVPQIAPNSSTPLYTDAGPYSFRLVASDVHQAQFMADYVARHAPRSRVAVLYVNDDYGRALNTALQTALHRTSASLVYEAPFINGEPFAINVNDVIRSLTDAAPDLLVWIGLPTELERLRAPLRAAVPRLRVLGSDGISFLDPLTTDLRAFIGDIVVSYADMASTRPGLQSVAARFRPMSGRAISDGAALTYDAVGILAEAMRAGAHDREAIQRALAEWGRTGHVYEGITGAIAFDKNGDALPSYVLMEVTARGMRRVEQ